MMDEIVSIITNNGVGVACLIYFMYRDYKFMSDLKETLAVIKDFVKKREKSLESEDEKK